MGGKDQTDAESPSRGQSHLHSICSLQMPEDGNMDVGHQEVLVLLPDCGPDKSPFSSGPQ